MPLHEDPPEVAEAYPVRERHRTSCSRCHRTLADHRYWRCPYVSCRAWLYGTSNPPPDKRKRKAEA